MLVLGRKDEQEIIIGRGGEEEIIIRILKTEIGQVRIGIEASKDYDIHRREIFEKIRNGVPHNKNPKVEKKT